MGSFSSQWLALREPADAAARAHGLEALLRDAVGGRPADSPLAVLDLGAGTGSNLRYAAPVLGGTQAWLLVDADPVLLQTAQGQLRAWAPQAAARFTERERQLVIQSERFQCSIRTLHLDLATGLAVLALPAGGLLTASALLDLVSEAWLRSLAERAAAAAVTVWFSLSYDGRIECSPPEPEDEEVRTLFNAHQRRDKGFGAALGPTAAVEAAQIFARHGYSLRSAASDWHLEPAQAALQHCLIEGWAQAAGEIAPARAAALHGWLRRRRQHIDGGRSKLTVGHVDLFGRPDASIQLD